MKLPVRIGFGSRVTPAGHVQMAAMQLPPRPQRTPHAPQLFASLVVAVQDVTPPVVQSWLPEGHVHTPAVQLWPVAQT